MTATVVRAAPRSSLAHWLGGAACCVTVACASTDTTVWTQFNAAEEAVEVDVGAPVRGAGASVTLTRASDSVEVGAGSVDAAAVAVGDIVTVRTRILDPWFTEVERVSVRIDSGALGVDEYDLDRDSAAAGVWEIAVEAAGTPDEPRTDTLTFRLWTASPT